MSMNQHSSIMNIDRLKNKNVVSFYVNKINILNSSEIETTLINLTTESESKLTLNLSNIKFIDSTGFKMLRRLNLRIKFNFININTEIQELFNLVKFNIS